MTLTFADVAVESLDDAPDTVEDAHYCKEAGCQNEVTRKGSRGRWPSYCDEHKTASSRSGGASTAKKTVATPAMAKQAADVLAQFHDLIAAGLMAATLMPSVPVELPNTVRAINERNDAFRVAAAEALATDPGLCRSILKVGKTGGKIALVSAYATLAIGIAPAVLEDVRDGRDARETAGGDVAP